MLLSGDKSSNGTFFIYSLKSELSKQQVNSYIHLRRVVHSEMLYHITKIGAPADII